MKFIKIALKQKTKRSKSTTSGHNDLTRYEEHKSHPLFIELSELSTTLDEEPVWKEAARWLKLIALNKKFFYYI